MELLIAVLDFIFGLFGADWKKVSKKRSAKRSKSTTLEA